MLPVWFFFSVKGCVVTKFHFAYLVDFCTEFATHGWILFTYFCCLFFVIVFVQIPFISDISLSFSFLKLRTKLSSLPKYVESSIPWNLRTLESGIDVGQGITVGPGKFVKKNKRRALNKRRAWTKCANLCYKKTIKLENIRRPWEKFQNLINVGPLIIFLVPSLSIFHLFHTCY